MAEFIYSPSLSSYGANKVWTSLWNWTLFIDNFYCFTFILFYIKCSLGHSWMIALCFNKNSQFPSCQWTCWHLRLLLLNLLYRLSSCYINDSHSMSTFFQCSPSHNFLFVLYSLTIHNKKIDRLLKWLPVNPIKKSSFLHMLTVLYNEFPFL